MTELLQPDQGGIARAARLLQAGELVAIPTETVYGLAADARSDRAVARVFEAKGRPSFNPLIVHVHSLAEAKRIAAFDDAALRLAEAFWPGPLTLVLPLAERGISRLVTAGGDSVAIRVPDHPLARAVLEATGGPLAAPSANPSGRISATTAEHVLSGLGGKIAAVLDGGATSVGLESTIVATDPPRLLRPGGLPVETVEACLGESLAERAEGQPITAPGQLSSHYAPEAALRLNATEPRGDEFLIGFGNIPGERSLSASGDLVEAAARLFDLLHEADASGRPIAVAPVPQKGLGLAINDRLKRAAAPRDQSAVQ